MTKYQSKASIIFDTTNNTYLCQGSWSIIGLKNLLTQFKQNILPKSLDIKISGAKLKKFDSAGALILMQCISALKKHKNQIELIDFNEQQRNLLALIEEKHDELNHLPKKTRKSNLLYKIGKETIFKIKQIDGLVILVGRLSSKLLVAIKDWRRFQVPSIISNINSAGIKALPIIAWLSFLIGVVLAYQLGLELETYGANSFIAYIAGTAIFREFGPLITAIIIAGRTSSSFTAQIGSMKINEEIDALNTMGLSSIEYLVVPKVLALVIAFPLLIFWSDAFSLLGAMLMSKFMLQIGYVDFMTKIQYSVGLKQMMLGLYKAPVFAVLTSLVGCFQGFRVEASADSVGSQTTKSVVQALFLIIIADAAFSVLYGWLDL